MKSEAILRRANILSLTVLLVLTLFGVTFSVTLDAQETFPNNIFVSSSEAQLHELVLKATHENGQTNTISGFKIDLTNVISASPGSELAIFTTDSALSINEAKLRTTADVFVDLKKKSQSSFSLADLPSGVYSIDVITQKGTANAAYEGILVVGQEPTDLQTRTIIEQKITNENEDDDDDDNGGNCDSSYPDVCIQPYPPDLNCDDITYKNFKVAGSDPHGFDRDGDGIGCESNETKPPIDPCLDNPNLPQCIDPCEVNPDSPECIDPCEVNPDSPECIDPCEVNPELEECQEPIPPEDPCDENPSLPECEEEEESVGESDEDESGDDEDESDGDSDSENENVEDESDEGNEGESNEGNEEGDEE